MAYHAKIFGASKAKQWGQCPGSVKQSEGIPDISSPDAMRGSAVHAVAESVLRQEVDHADALVDSEVSINGSEAVLIANEMADLAQTYVNDLDDLTPTGALRVIEQWVSYSSIIDQPDAGGTADALVITEDEIHVHDLKAGHVEVDAEENWQLMLYALGAHVSYGLLHDFKTIRLYIHQPRHNRVSEWSCSLEHLLQFGEQMKERAARVFTHPHEYNPGEEQCRYCKGKATCPALTKAVLDEFDVLPDPVSKETDNTMLARGMSHIELIEGWCKAVRAETERRLLAGQQIKGFKLVEGRRGHRKWTDAKEAEAILKQMRVKNDDMYEQKLISPTKAEKLMKAGRLGPRQWSSISEHITQSEGKPSVAKADDAREAIQVEMDFDLIA